MLVLSRKAMERIEIGSSIVVTVLGICGNKVRIGIDAPKEIGVVRAELRDRVSDRSGSGSQNSVAPTESHVPGDTVAWQSEGGDEY